MYSKAEAEKLAAEKGWAIAPDGDKYRRVVASPRPFIKTKSYFGPDRRRMNSPNYSGPERRKGGKADVFRQSALLDKVRAPG